MDDNRSLNPDDSIKYASIWNGQEKIDEKSENLLVRELKNAYICSKSNSVMRKEVYIGAINYDDNGNIVSYETGGTDNGWCFKDKDAWKSGEGICYIPEYDASDMEEELTDLQSQYENSDMTDEEYRNKRKEIFSLHGYTRKQIVDLCGGEGFDKLAESVFYEVDWQSPETLISEWDYIDFDYYGITKEMVENSPVWKGWEIVED